MPALRELWRLYPDRANFQVFTDMWGRRPVVGQVAPVASSVISGELPIETTVVRFRLPLLEPITARSVFVDVTRRRWFVNEVGQVGRWFVDVSLSTYVPTVSLGAGGDVGTAQRGYSVGFHETAPDGTRLRSGSILLESWDFGADLSVTRSRPGDGVDADVWLEFVRGVGGTDGIVHAPDPVLGVLRASGEISQPFWVELPAAYGSGHYRVRFLWITSTGATLPGGAGPASDLWPLLELPPLVSQYPAGAVGLGLSIRGEDQVGALQAIPPQAATASELAGTSLRVLRESEIPGG